MRSWQLQNRWSTVGVVVIMVVIAVIAYHQAKPAAPKNYVLPNDNFNQDTMDEIWKDIHQWNVESTPQDHSLYVLTGGLHMANPVITYASSDGTFAFAPHPTNQPNYRFTEWARSPADWSYQQNTGPSGGTSIKMGGTPMGKLVPWVKHETSMGRTYFEWDMSSNMTWYYFKHGDTYITIQVDDLGSKTRPPFPSGVMTHLVAIGNPVQ